MFGMWLCSWGPINWVFWMCAPDRWLATTTWRVYRSTTGPESG